MSSTDRKRHFHRDWINGFETEDVKKADYESILCLNEQELNSASSQYMKSYSKAVNDFQTKTSLTSLDIAILTIAATLQTLRWAILSNDKMRFSKASDADDFLKNTSKKIRNSEFLPASVEQIATDLSNHTVPYDAVARSDRFMSLYKGESVGLAGYNHRYKALGHDPLAGLIFGTANIATNTITINDFSRLFPSYHVVNQQIDGKTSINKVIKWTGQLCSDKPEIIGASFIRQIIHCGTDFFTKQGLPLPVINVISPETSKFLIGKQIDVYSVMRSATLAIIINKFIEMLHRIFFDINTDDELLYDIRTKKILLYSNTFSSILNVGYVALTKDIKRLDIGGILVTLWNFLTNRPNMERLQLEFINKTLDRELQKEEDEVSQQLAKWGFEI